MHLTLRDKLKGFRLLDMTVRCRDKSFPRTLWAKSDQASKDGGSYLGAGAEQYQAVEGGQCSPQPEGHWEAG